MFLITNILSHIQTEGGCAVKMDTQCFPNEDSCKNYLTPVPSSILWEQHSIVDTADQKEDKDIPIPAVVIHNIVSTSVIHGNNMPINLHDLSILLPCSTYDKRRFAAITIRIDNPRCTALLFTSGKVCCNS